MDIGKSRSLFKRGKVEIKNPIHGDRFILEGSQKNFQIMLKAQVDRFQKKVTWYIDGNQYDLTRPPFETPWKPSKGLHTITAIGTDQYGDSISLFVE